MIRVNSRPSTVMVESSIETFVAIGRAAAFNAAKISAIPSGTDRFSRSECCANEPPQAFATVIFSYMQLKFSDGE